MRKFQPSNSSSREVNRARNKNCNSNVLQYIYHGDSDIELHCVMTGTSKFAEVWSPTRKKTVQHFLIDFDHIRQKKSAKTTGNSVDKTVSPSEIFRSKDLFHDRLALLEMMCCWPISVEYHGYKSTDSKYGDIVLNDYPKEKWTWCLQNEKNFNAVCQKYGLGNLSYKRFIDTLNDVDAPRIVDQYRNGELLMEMA